MAEKILIIIYANQAKKLTKCHLHQLRVYIWGHPGMHRQAPTGLVCIPTRAMSNDLQTPYPGVIRRKAVELLQAQEGPPRRDSHRVLHRSTSLLWILLKGGHSLSRPSKVRGSSSGAQEPGGRQGSPQQVTHSFRGRGCCRQWDHISYRLSKGKKRNWPL